MMQAFLSIVVDIVPEHIPLPVHFADTFSGTTTIYGMVLCRIGLGRIKQSAVLQQIERIGRSSMRTVPRVHNLATVVHQIDVVASHQRRP